jgi:meromycolic acid (3R)-3-hydroxyacyl-[acyl-carrier protein] dehydratase HadB
MIEVGHELPELRRIVTAEDVKAYADAGGDRNPLHQDDAVARAAGFPGIIAHGMFTMGHMAAAVSAFAGDASKVVRISAQFRAPVFMGEEIVAGGRVVAVDDETATLETWVRVDRDDETAWPIKKGQAVIRRSET